MWVGGFGGFGGNYCCGSNTSGNYCYVPGCKSAFYDKNREKTNISFFFSRFLKKEIAQCVEACS